MGCYRLTSCDKQRSYALEAENMDGCNVHSAQCKASALLLLLLLLLVYSGLLVQRAFKGTV